MFCPKCGTKLGEIKWERLHKYLPPETVIKCQHCEAELRLEDRSGLDQECSSIEIILH